MDDVLDDGRGIVQGNEGSGVIIRVEDIANGLLRHVANLEG